MVRWLVVVIALHGTPGLAAQAARLVVSPNLPIPAEDPTAPIVEVDFALDPQDPDHMIAAAIVVDSAATDIWIGSHIDVFTTMDGGAVWDQRRFQMIAGADPWLSMDPEGRVFLSYLGMRTNPGDVELLYHSSTDGGSTWTDARSLGTGHDRETMTSAWLDGRSVTFLTSSRARWTSENSSLTYAYVARSVDGGGLDSLAALLPNNLRSNTFTTVVTRDGTLILSLLDYATGTFQMLDTRRAWVIASEDQGVTFSKPRFVAEDLAPRTYFVIAGDPTDRFAPGRLYAVRTVAPDSTPSILLSWSDDHGRSWSEDVTVADPVAGARPIGPANIAVDEEGTVGVAWFDSRNGGDVRTVDLYVSVSSDGGATFTEEARVTEVTSANDTVANGRAVDRFGQGGDYFGMQPHPEGGFQLLWADSRTGVYQLYTAHVGIAPG